MQGISPGRSHQNMEILSINRFEVHVISPTIEVLKPPSTGTRHDPIGANQGSSLILRCHGST